MRVTCPACAATYDVPDARIGAGRRLRCARCQHGWFVAPPALESTPPESTRPLEETPFARAVERAAPPPPIASGSSPEAALAADAAAEAGRAGASPAASSIPAAGAGQSSGSAAGTGGPDGIPREDPPGRGGHAPTPQPAAAGLAPLAAASPPGHRAAGRQDRSGMLMVAWVASLMLFLGFAAAVVLYRVEIMERWPPAERFYVALGMLQR